MDQSKALQKLTEAADLAGMVEELVRTSQSERLSPATTSGMRITLRNIRDSILNSHDVFAGELVTRTRSRSEAAMPQSEPAHQNAMQPSHDSTLADPSRLGMRRQSIRSSVEKQAD